MLTRYKNSLIRTLIRPIRYKLHKYDKEISRTDNIITFTRYSELSYEDVIVRMIRLKYSLNQELAILRQKDSKLAEYNEYYQYAELCKAEAKAFIQARNEAFGE